MIFKQKNGFSVLEAVVTVFIFSIITGIFVVYIVRSYESYYLLSNSSKIQEKARQSLYNLSKEIRSAKQGEHEEFPIAEASEQSLIFYSNIDSLPDIEKVSYSLEGSNLKKNIIKPSGGTYLGPGHETIFLSNVINSGPIFNYFDKDYNGSGSPLNFPVDINEVTYIEISLSIDDDTEEPPGPQEFKTGICLRNLKTNLDE